MRFITVLAFICLFMALASMATAQDFTCDFSETMHFCYEYNGQGWDKDSAQMACEMAGQGKFSTGSCPRDNVAGICTYDLEEKSGQTVQYYFYLSGFTEELAKMSCPGTFTAP